MSTPAHYSRTHRFGALVALYLQNQDANGDTDGRTQYLTPAHALQTAANLIKVAIDCAEVEAVTSECGSPDSVAANCEVSSSMDAVVQLIDREALGTSVLHARQLLERCQGHVAHYGTMQHAHSRAPKDAADMRALLRDPVGMSQRDQAILGQIAEGVAELERRDKETKLEGLTVCFGDGYDDGLGKYPLGQALEILLNNLRQDRDGVDISRRTSAEVWPSIDTPAGSLLHWDDEEGEA